MDLSIVFATFKNENILEKSLQAYCQIKTHYTWELIIIDNACRPETRAVVECYQKHLPIVFLEQPIQGKNNALNKAIPLAQSEIIFFTDNDILPASNIIDVYVDATRNNTEVDVFGGKILPDIELPAWIDISASSIQAAFGILDIESHHISPESVWGGNMVLRRRIFEDGMSFNGQIGPAGSNYIMGSETELLLRLKALGCKALFLPEAVTLHQIRAEQLSIIWLMKRAFRAGKGYYFNDPDIATRFFGYSRYILRLFLKDLLKVLSAILTLNKSSICLAIMSAATTAGKLVQSKASFAHR
jgi:glycosyltransferase involved in cell wall biosynthesis